MANQKNVYEDEDIRVWRRYKMGDQQAKWELLNRFKGLISGIAIKQSHNLPRPVVEAKLKQYTIQAFDTYDPSKGTKLSTHVTYYLQKINRDNYNNQQAIRLPENLAIGYSRFMEGKTRLHESLGREPTGAELAGHLGWSLSAVENAEKKYHKEFVESRQVYEPGVSDTDIADTAISLVYHQMNDDERYLFEHKTGYLGKELKPMDKIRKELNKTPHQFHKLQTGLTGKFQDTLHALHALDKED